MNETINILLVDDEPRNLDALEAILADPGYRLLRADDADKALKHLLENDVAAIVLDIKMPGVSGFELAQLIKRTKKFRQIPIVFLTAYLVEDQDVIAGYTAGAVDYLTKPVNPQILRHKISVFAELFRKTRALAELNSTLEQRVQERTAELETSEAALRRAGEQKDAFLATLAHELRNPLAPLRTGLELLRRQAAATSGSDRVLDAMERQVLYMVRVIDDLLDVSRITRGMLELRKEPADLATSVRQALEMTRPFLEKKQLRVRLELAEPLVTSIDATRVTQIIGNLLHNASKYSPAGGEVLVTLQRVGPDAVIRVSDSGAGIPVDQLERVFDTFARIPRSVQADGGLGIGLSLARKLAELHGGSLSADSAGEGRGATFTLSIPIPAAAAAHAVEAANEEGPRQASALKIVVIEDNVDSAELLVMWLEEMGHEVRLAVTGAEGVNLVRDATPDVVLCDIGLPGMDGVEVCRRVRGLELRRRPVMVALTGWGMASDRRRTADAGFDHHLVKPVAMRSLQDLLTTLRSDDGGRHAQPVQTAQL
jgi:signal transduction histidine kinase